jgi:hypothetical protein
MAPPIVFPVQQGTRAFPVNLPLYVGALMVCLLPPSFGERLE